MAASNNCSCNFPTSDLTALRRLAQCESGQYFTTTPGIGTRAVLEEEVDGVRRTVYVKSSAKGLLVDASPIKVVLLGGPKAFMSELPGILRIIEKFLTREELNFRSSDLLPLTTLDHLLRRMGAEHGNVVQNIYFRIHGRLLDAQRPIPITEGVENGAASGFTEERKRPRSESPPFQPESKRLRVVSHSDDIIVEPSTDNFPPVEVEQRGLERKRPRENDARFEPAPKRRKQGDLSTSTEAMSLLPMDISQTFEYKEKGDYTSLPEDVVSLVQRDSDVRDVNTAWWFPDLSSKNKEGSKCVADSLLRRGEQNVPLSEEEWCTLARSLVVLLRAVEPYEKHAESVFLRFFLHNDRRTQLPKEFIDLFAFLRGRGEFPEFFTFLQSVSPAAAQIPHTDPVGLHSLRRLYDDFRSSRWQDCDFTLRGFSSKTPWRNVGDERSDRDCIVDLCSFLAKNHSTAESFLSPESLDSLCLVMAFVLSSHSLKSLPGCKKDFQKISSLLQPLALLLGKINPVSEEERQRNNNFLRLYYFYEGSNFLSRMKNERQKPVHRWERFSLWGVKGPHTTKLAGNEKAEFSLDQLKSYLEEVRIVALSEGKKVAKPSLPSSIFVVSPSIPLWIEPPLEKLMWHQIFAEVFSKEGDGEDSWSCRQEKAGQFAQTLSQEFRKMLMPMDFESVVLEVQNGRTEVSSFLDRFEDKGLVLLRDYVYPYCSLMKFISTPSHHEVARFVSRAASGGEIAVLGGGALSSQIAVLKNVLCIMAPGGYLQSSVIHTDQTFMLKAMASCIEERKQVFIRNDTGTGKTTMSKLAPLIVSFQVPLVLHIAPFTQNEDGWKRMRKWSDLDVRSEKTTHFWITASEMASLMKDGVPKQYESLLQDSFILADEYDHETYVIPGALYATIQDELYFTYGCRRIVNMSATPNLESLGNMILRYKEKLSTLESLSGPGSMALAEGYRRKIEQLSSQHEMLIKAMAREWNRQITISTNASENAYHQVKQVFQDVSRFDFLGEDRSFLIEMPRYVLEAKLVDLFHEEMRQSFLQQPVAVLFRDSDGNVQAHFSRDGVKWKVMSLMAFGVRYTSEKIKPVVCCFYTQDSVGGDFGPFSHERFVRLQCIVNSGEIAPSYAIFQNFRRQRTRDTKSQLPSRTPVIFYLGERAQKEILLTTEEEQEIHVLPESKREEERQARQKAKLLAKADSTAKDLSRLGEISRLKMKCVQKKHRVIKEVLLEDMVVIQDFFSRNMQNPPFLKDVQARLEKLFSAKIGAFNVGFDADIERVRKGFLVDLLNSLQVTPQDSPFQPIFVQENEALILIRDAFNNEESGSRILEAEDPYRELQSFLGKLNCRRSSCADLWAAYLAPKARLKKDTLLHPVPSREAVAAALRKVRGVIDTSGIPDVAEDIELGPIRQGVRFLPPDKMVKSMIGAHSHDSLRVKAFMRNLQKEAEHAVSYQAKHETYQKENALLLERLKRDLLQHVELLGSTSETLLFSILVLARGRYKKIATHVDQMMQYHDRYQEYSQFHQNKS